MQNFVDANGYQVEFSESEEFGEAWHVLVLSHLNNHWVLTQHKTRGLEFPGGKREAGESIEDAAIREVYEEIGGIVNELLLLGQYRVNDPTKPFVKSIYYAELEKLEPKSDYLETAGPVLIEKLPADIKKNPRYSFIMKDEIIALSLTQLKKKGTIVEL